LTCLVGDLARKNPYSRHGWAVKSKFFVVESKINHACREAVLFFNLSKTLVFQENPYCRGMAEVVKSKFRRVSC